MPEIIDKAKIGRLKSRAIYFGAAANVIQSLILQSRQMGEDALIDALIVVDSHITVSECHSIGDIFRNEFITHFDAVMDVLIHVDPEDDKDLFKEKTADSSGCKIFERQL